MNQQQQQYNIVDQAARRKVTYLIYQTASLDAVKLVSNHAYFKVPFGEPGELTQKFQEIAENAETPLPDSIVVYLPDHIAQDGLLNYLNSVADLCEAFRIKTFLVNIPPVAAAAGIVLDVRRTRHDSRFGKVCLLDPSRYCDDERAAAGSLLSVAKRCEVSNRALIGGLEEPE